MIRVEVNQALNTMVLISIFDKKIISKEDISNYYTTVYYRDRKRFRGLLLHLKNNKSILLFAQNLKSINEMEEYLIGRNINYYNEIKSKFPFE